MSQRSLIPFVGILFILCCPNAWGNFDERSIVVVNDHPSAKKGTKQILRHYRILGLDIT